MGEVIELIQGDSKRAEMGQPSVVIEEGSLRLVSIVEPQIADSFYADMELISQTQDLDAISPKRAAIIESWQNRSLKTDSRRHYRIVLNANSKDSEVLQIGLGNEFRHKQIDNWVRAEKYLVGRVVDVGGKTKPNIHLELPSGKSLMVEASESQLEGADYLYRTITLNVIAMENVRTGELRDLRLIDVVRPSMEVDEDKLRSLWRKGREAWAGITRPTEWVEDLRGS